MSELFKSTTATSNIPHYFGNTVRRLFILNGAIVLLALPFFKNFLPIPTLFSITAIVLLIVFAAMTNPLLPAINKTNVAISALGLIIFENLAVASYEFVPLEQSIIYQILAIIFFFALYFGVKTFRAMAIGQITPQTVEKAAVDEIETNQTNRDLLTDMQKDEHSERM